MKHHCYDNNKEIIELYYKLSGFEMYYSMRVKHAILRILFRLSLSFPLYIISKISIFKHLFNYFTKIYLYFVIYRQKITKSMSTWICMTKLDTRKITLTLLSGSSVIWIPIHMTGTPKYNFCTHLLETVVI